MATQTSPSRPQAAPTHPRVVKDTLAFVHSMPDDQLEGRWNAVRTDVNSANPSTRTAIGLHIVIDAADPDSNLYRETHAGPEALTVAGQKVHYPVSKLALICDTLTIRSPWHLPECDVVVHARRLVFEADGCIDTSPAPWAADRAPDAVGNKPGGNGVNGHDAGNISAFVSEVSVPDGSTQKRLVLKGGPGQGGGFGLPGGNGFSPARTFAVPNGYRYKTSHKDSGFTTHVDVALNKHAGYTVVGVKRHWKAMEWVNVAYIVDGADQPPTSGKPAVKPGKSGNGGRPGKLVTSLARLVELADVTPGPAGATAPTVAGGVRGEPHDWAIYDCTFWCRVFGGENSGSAKVSVATGHTANGEPGQGVPGQPGAAQAPQLLTDAKPAAWFHPLLAGQVVNFIRDAYLGEKRPQAKALLDTYVPVMQGPMPLKHPGAVWQQKDAAYWRSLETELTTLSQRLDAGLDYFGKPAGYMPLLSLPGSLQMYRMDVDIALEVLMFTDWVSRMQKQSRETVDVKEAAYRLISKENAKLIAKLADNHAAVARLNDRIQALDASQSSMTAQLERVRLSLIGKASGNVFMLKQIKFAANAAAALCQFIPVGQPILGGVASIAATSTEFLDEDPGKVLDKLKTSFTGTVAAYKAANKETQEAVEAATKEAKEMEKAGRKKLSADEIKDMAKSKVSMWSTAAKGLAPAWTHAKEAYSNLRVTDSEIEARIQQLASQDEEWKKVSKDIEALIELRGSVVEELIHVNQDIGEAFGALADNVDSMMQLQEESSLNRNRLLDSTVVGIIEGMRLRARLALTESLYRVVRAFESNLLEPVSVNWSFDSFYQDINKLLDGQPIAKWNDETVQARTQTLRALFNDNLRQVRDDLRHRLAELDLKDREVPVVIDAGMPDVLAALNAGDDARVDALRLNLIDPAWQRQMLAGMELIDVLFDDESALPQQGKLEIIVTFDEAGIIRHDGRLYGVHLEAAPTHSFSYLFDGRRVSAATTSALAADLLRMLMDDPKDAIRQKLALPPAWSDITLRARFTGTHQKVNPRIKALKFRCTVSSRLANRNQVVLDVRCNLPSVALECAELEPAPFHELYKVQDGKSTVCTLKPAAHEVGPWHFDHWVVTDGAGTRDVKSEQLELKLRQHTQVECVFEAH